MNLSEPSDSDDAKMAVTFLRTQKLIDIYTHNKKLCN